ncbi:MAG: HAD family hydrolase [Candidatus Nanoarchaeia archaeon]
MAKDKYYFMKDIKMKVLIFDYDGVLVDSLETVFKMFNTMEKRHERQPVSMEEYLTFYDNNFWESIKKKGVTQEQIEETFSEVQAYLIAHKDEMPIFPGVVPVINELTEKFTSFIISSNFTKVVELRLNTMGIKVKDIIGADKIQSKQKKILHIKEQYPDAEIFYIGDTKGDMLEAKEAGVKSVAVTWGYHPKERIKEANPDFIADTPEELRKILTEH